MSSVITGEQGNNATKPFLIDLGRLKDTEGTSQAPIAGVLITRAFRTSGFLQALPAQDLKNLMLLLSFATPYGLGRPTLQQLARAMHTTESKARSRMSRLEQFPWHGGPLVRELRRSDGDVTYMVSPNYVKVVEHSAKTPTPTSDTQETLRDAAPASGHERQMGPVSIKDAIVANARAKYSRRRDDVEKEIVAFWDNPAGDPAQPAVSAAGRQPTSATQRDGLREQLLDVGLDTKQTDDLLVLYDRARIEQQLLWLPHRKARNKAGLLIAALERNYDEPLKLRLNKRSAKRRPK